MAVIIYVVTNAEQGFAFVVGNYFVGVLPSEVIPANSAYLVVNIVSYLTSLSAEN